MAAAAGIDHEMFVPGSLLVQWHITDGCNLNCTHCYRDTAHAGLPFDDLVAILGQIRELLALLRSGAGGRRLPAHITITGGEPFLRDDFFTLLELLHAARHEFSFAILSNGSLIPDGVARELARFGPGFVQLSLEGAEATHDGIRGPGDFQRVTRAAAALGKARVPLLISFTAHRGNFSEFPLVAELGRRLGARRVWADRFIPLGGVRGERERVLSPEETREFLEIMRRARHAGGRFGGTEIAMHRALQFLRGGGRPYRCQAGRELLTILADGRLCPCRRLPIPVGSLLTSSLVRLYRESGLLRILREGAVTCRGCEGCLYERLCSGGLRCLAYALTGELHVADPGCWLSANGAG